MADIRFLLLSVFSRTYWQIRSFEFYDRTIPHFSRKSLFSAALSRIVMLLYLKVHGLHAIVCVQASQKRRIALMESLYEMFILILL